MNSIFIFRRSLRLEDNNGLIECLEQSSKVYPIFIFTPEQVTENKYKSDNAVQFMIESLQDLNEHLKKYNSRLYLFYGDVEETLTKIISKTDISSIFVNRDYTPYSEHRDEKIYKLCQKHKLHFNTSEDILMQPIDLILTGSKTAYKIYTPFYKKAATYEVKKPVNTLKPNFVNKSERLSGEIDFDRTKQFFQPNPEKLLIGGRSQGLKLLNKISEQKDYNKYRTIVSYQTSHLSAYLKFGCVSPREVFHHCNETLTTDNQLISELYWREFFYHIIFHYPKVVGEPLFPKKIKWKNDKPTFDAWKDARTGFPIVDASMRQLNSTGYMSNRGRLIVANFLVKLCNIDWREGERYFATKLIDYDVAVNNGNWQWVAGVGTDQGKNRIFSPILQSEKSDPDAEFIRQWIPELESVPTRDIHYWNISYQKHNSKYPKPLFDYQDKRKEAIDNWKK